jgi:tetratricopeptide (TPR) repeat protein
MKRIRSLLFVSILATIAAAGCVGSFPAAAATLAQTRARCLSNNISGDESVTACTAAINKNPKDAKLYVRRGLAWNSTGDYDYAIGDFSKAIRLDPHNALAFFNRGIAREKKGELQESLGDFKRCAEMRRLDPDAQTAIERVTVALAAKTPPQTASAAIAEHFGNASVAQAERTGEPQTSTAQGLSSAGDDFSLFIPALFLIASIAAVAMLMHKGGSRTADDHPLLDNLEPAPVVASEVSPAIMQDPPLAWYWSEYKGELDQSSS